MRAAFDALPGLRAEDVETLPNDRGLRDEFRPQRRRSSRSATTSTTTLRHRSRVPSHVRSLPEEEFSFSPDGRQAAFIRRNNLYVVNLEQQRQEKQLTTSGTDQLLNGKLDWVYQEEIYGRGNFQAYWWSPDSAHWRSCSVDDRGAGVHGRRSHPAPV